jgi:hypothetical protein
MVNLNLEKSLTEFRPEVKSTACDSPGIVQPDWLDDP